MQVMFMNYNITNLVITFLASPIMMFTQDYKPIMINSQYELKVALHDFDPKKAKL